MQYRNESYHSEAKDGHYHGAMDTKRHENTRYDFEVDTDFSEKCADHL